MQRKAFNYSITNTCGQFSPKEELYCKISTALIGTYHLVSELVHNDNEQGMN
jgi:hypothetical protein